MPQPLPGLLGFDIPAHCYKSREMLKYKASCPAQVCCIVPHQEWNSKSTFKTTLPTSTERLLFHHERVKKIQQHLILIQPLTWMRWGSGACASKLARPVLRTGTDPVELPSRLSFGNPFGSPSACTQGLQKLPLPAADPCLLSKAHFPRVVRPAEERFGKRAG